MPRKPRLSITTRQGRPIAVLGRTLTPVARVTSACRRRGTIRASSVEGRAWGAGRVQPLHVVEQRDGKERTLAIPDVTRTVLSQMAAVAVLVALVASVLIWSNGRSVGR